MTNRLSGHFVAIINGLDHFRWWIWAVLMGTFAFSVTADAQVGLLANVLVGVCVLLLWVPRLVRRGIIVGRAFREGLDEG
jgi:hypothetical protein